MALFRSTPQSTNPPRTPLPRNGIMYQITMISPLLKSPTQHCIQVPENLHNSNVKATKNIKFYIFLSLQHINQTDPQTPRHNTKQLIRRKRKTSRQPAHHPIPKKQHAKKIHDIDQKRATPRRLVRWYRYYLIL